MRWIHIENLGWLSWGWGLLLKCGLWGFDQGWRVSDMLPSLLGDLADDGHRGARLDLLRLSCRYQLQDLGGLYPWWVDSPSTMRRRIHWSGLRDTTSDCSFSVISIRTVELLFLSVIETCTWSILLIENSLFSDWHALLTLTSTVDLSYWGLIVRYKNLRITKGSFFSGFLKDLGTEIDTDRLFLGKSLADSCGVALLNFIRVGESLMYWSLSWW